MSYQQGTANIGNGVTTTVVTFPVEMAATPAAILVSIENTTDASPLQHLDPTVKAKSTTGFTVEYSASTSTANYKLVWWAGSTMPVYQGVVSETVKISALPAYASAPHPSGYIPYVSMVGTPTTERVTWAVLYGLFGRLTSVPTNVNTPGVAGNWAVDSEFLYSHDGTLWGRTPRVTSNWDIDTLVELVQEGTEDLTAGEQTLSVVFETAYSDVPHVTVGFENTSVDNPKQVLIGIVSARSTTGFSVLLNTTPDTVNYKMHWRATGPQPV